MSQYAIPWFNPEYQSWCCGYYDSDRGGGPSAWTICRTEESARAMAREYNFAQPLGPFEKTMVDKIRRCCADAFEMPPDYPFFYADENAPDKDNRLAMDHYLFERYQVEQGNHPKWSEREVVDLLING